MCIKIQLHSNSRYNFHQCNAFSTIHKSELNFVSTYINVTMWLICFIFCVQKQHCMALYSHRINSKTYCMAHTEKTSGCENKITDENHEWSIQMGKNKFRWPFKRIEFHSQYSYRSVYMGFVMVEVLILMHDFGFRPNFANLFWIAIYLCDSVCLLRNKYIKMLFEAKQMRAHHNVKSKHLQSVFPLIRVYCFWNAFLINR